jgi:D-glycero-D-manno-heptose 1,7-bisphosphate phosphatase
MNTGFLKQIQTDWTLFLDRDGVINHRPPNDYVKSKAELIFLSGALEAIGLLSKKFNRIIVVTNQQGIAKQLMTTDDLHAIHNHMATQIKSAGGRIDKFYFCPDLADSPNNCRKPNPAMAQWAKADFPEIDFKKSVMVGDTQTDIGFGVNLGMFTVLLGHESSTIKPDACFENLLQFANSIISANR